MAQFLIYQHPDGTLIPVKDGWCWPGFFFSGFWLLYRGLYLLGVLIVFAGSFASVFLSNPFRFFYLAFFFDLTLCFVVAINGNSWLKEGVTDRGFEFVCTVEAKTADGARAAFIRRNPDVPSRREPTF